MPQLQLTSGLPWLHWDFGNKGVVVDVVTASLGLAVLVVFSFDTLLGRSWTFRPSAHSWLLCVVEMVAVSNLVLLLSGYDVVL